jgi:hypothetical protein
LVKLGFNTIFQTVMHYIIHSDSIAHYSDSVKKVWKDNRWHYRIHLLIT